MCVSPNLWIEHGVASVAVSCTYGVFHYLLAIQVGNIFGVFIFYTTLFNGLTITSDGTRLEVFDLRYLVEELDTELNLIDADLALTSIHQRLLNERRPRMLERRQVAWP